MATIAATKVTARARTHMLDVLRPLMAPDRNTNTSLTELRRASSQYNEEQVFVQRGLENEKRVTLVRLLTFFLLMASQWWIAVAAGRPQASQADWVRLAIIAAYLSFAIGSFIAVRRVKPDARRGRIIPLISSTMDVAFVLAMDWRDYVTYEGIRLENAAVMYSLLITYALLRYSHVSLFLTTAMAIVGFVIQTTWTDRPFSWPDFTFVVFVFIALTTLMWSTRKAIRAAFVDLKRRENLSRFVPPKVVDQILAGREELLVPQRREVSVLFSDIRDFTTFSEERDPQHVLAFLDDYFGRMTQVVRGHDGSVNKFIGDGMLATWGAPETLEDHAYKAVKAALDMRKVVAELNEQRTSMGEPPLRIGVGIHTGIVAAGMLGGVEQHEYTVIGDAVNVAARIEGLTKEHGVDIVVSETTWSKLQGRVDGARLGEVRVKGRHAPVVIYAVRDVLPVSAQPAGSTRAAPQASTR